MIPYGKQSINKDDIDAVNKVLKSDYLTQGPKVAEFENDLAKYCGAEYAKAVTNATSALHLAYLAIGLGSGDILWTTPNTFVATANAALYCGAKVDFVDIDSNTYNISIESLKLKLIHAKKENMLPKIVVPVHFAGQSSEMKEIWNLSKEYGFRVIEDASHALGADYLDSKVGSCRFSDMAIFSFHPVKMITTGEGGAILTNNKVLDYEIGILRSHGIEKNVSKFEKKTDGDWYYEQQKLGFNYRLTDMQAALGISQLKRLDDFVKRRREIAKYYFSELKDVVLPYQHLDANSSWHLFVIRVKRRKLIYQKLKTKGIHTQIHYIPVTQQPFFNRKNLKNSNSFYKECLSLPIYVDLTNREQSIVIEEFKNC